MGMRTGRISRVLAASLALLSIPTIALAGWQLLFVVNVLWSLRSGVRVGRNPWQATTLEWEAPSPPGHGNFLTEPIVYRGPYEYSVPGAARDFTPQFEPERG